VKPFGTLTVKNASVMHVYYVMGYTICSHLSLSSASPSVLIPFFAGTISVLCHSASVLTVGLGAHWQLLLLNYLVARMENTAFYESARTGNFSVAATKKLLADAARPILDATGMLLIRIGRTCFSLSACTGNRIVAC
jgi:hypothetical protein